MDDAAPIPPHLERAALAWARYKKIMRWMALAAVAAVMLALIYLQLSGDIVSVHVVIATVAGVGLTVLLGTGLMGLLFVSAASGHDEDAHQYRPPSDGRE